MSSQPDRRPPPPAPGLVSNQWQDLYEGQYDSPLRKRQIAAKQTFEHMRTVFPGRIHRMLDVGAGEGSLLQCMSRGGVANELYAVEISSSGVDAIRARSLPHLVEAQKFDGYHVPYPDDFFDVAYAVHVLEHVEHERQFLREIARVAKQFIIEVPLENTMRVERSIRLCREHGHINLYTPVTLRNLLETTDLQVEDLQLNGNSLEYERFASGRAKGSAKFAIRTAFVRGAPKVATVLMTYNCTVLARRV